MTAVLFFSNSGSSVVDYSLLSCNMLSSVCITSLEVENMIESDHLPVVVAINVSQNAAIAVDQSNAIQENRQTGLTEKIIWQEDKEPIFKKQLNSNKVQKTLEAAKAKLQHDVDGALGDFVECLISASQCIWLGNATRTNIPKVLHGLTLNAEKRKEKVSKNCENFGKQEKPEDRKDYADSNKSYRRLTRIKKKKFRRNKASHLATNLKNASVFWKELKSLGGEKKVTQVIELI